jgi:hypothetical protein
MADHSGELVFDSALLAQAERTLKAEPQLPAVTAANLIDVVAGPFGEVPGGAEVAGRLAAWSNGVKAQMALVDSEVKALAGNTGAARDMAIEVDPATQRAARQGTPG